MQVYARPYAFRHPDGFTMFNYTLNKEYVAYYPESIGSYDFFIEDDKGNRVPCWWHADPEVLWERIKR